jgi:putative membrane protein insertion efficiency factor
VTALRWVWKGPALVVSAALIVCVRGYQYLIRPVLPPMCRYHPGCSEYFILAVKKYGPVVGAAKGAWRICRCNPWSRGGYDPP